MQRWEQWIFKGCVVGLAALGAATARADAAGDDVATLKKMLEKAENFMPSDYNKAMDLIQKVGPEAATPELMVLLKDRSGGANKIAFGCDGIERVGTVAALELVQSWLESKEWLVRCACANAFGRLLAKEETTEDVRKKGAQFLFQRVQAEMAARQPQTAIRVGEALGWVIFDAQLAHETMNQWAEKGDYWTRQIGLASMVHRQKYHNIAGEIAVKVLADDKQDPAVRTAAALVVSELKVYGARDTLRAIASLPKDPGGNLLAGVYEAMSVVGVKEDIPVLKKGMSRDPAGAHGFQTVKAKAAIKAIEARLTDDEKGGI